MSQTFQTNNVRLAMCLLATIAQLSLLSPQPCSAQTSCAVKPAGLIAWWPGDGPALDVVGTNHGTMQNGAWYAAGKVGQAFGFDGADDFVEIAHLTGVSLEKQIPINPENLVTARSKLPQKKCTGEVLPTKPPQNCFINRSACSKIL